MRSWIGETLDTLSLCLGVPNARLSKQSSKNSMIRASTHRKIFTGDCNEMDTPYVLYAERRQRSKDIAKRPPRSAKLGGEAVKHKSFRQLKRQSLCSCRRSSLWPKWSKP